MSRGMQFRSLPIPLYRCLCFAALLLFARCLHTMSLCATFNL